MKLFLKITFVFFFYILFINSNNIISLADTSSSQEEILKIKSFDNEYIIGKLNLPNSENINKLVIFVSGTGPNTYDNTRIISDKKYNYYDLFSKEFTKKNIGFFRYNTRGTDIGDLPPNFDKVDKDKYKNYLPMNQVQDIENIISFFKSQNKFKNTKIYLLGWSEGSIIAPIVAERGKVDIRAILLAGYVNDNLRNVIEWQLSGESSMILLGKFFDKDSDMKISKSELENDPYKVAEKIYGKNSKFEDLNLNKDDFITKEDLGLMLYERKKQVLNAIDNGDDDWIWNNYFRITSNWAKEHFKLTPNSSRLLKLNLPIYIFHGKYDQNVPVEGVIEIEKKFKLSNKKNLNTYIFDNNDHNLNSYLYPLKDTISEGIQKIFSVVEND